MSKPQIGDRVRILLSEEYLGCGIVLATDYHPLGLHDAVKIQFDNDFDKTAEWWNTRWVMKEPKEAHDG